MCRPFWTRHVNVMLPGTAVPGYRLFRPCGTASLWHLLRGKSKTVPEIQGWKLCRTSLVDCNS
jgi:hypothetical protein